MSVVSQVLTIIERIFIIIFQHVTDIIAIKFNLGAIS
ncbi:hypothetical protein [Candidatus Pantoea carbekii]